MREVAIHGLLLLGGWLSGVVTVAYIETRREERRKYTS